MPLLLELQYFPPIPYFALLFAHPKVLIEQHEHYQKRSYRNRTHIAGVNGLLRLSIPLKKGKNQQQNIRAVRIGYDESWASQHWHSIRSAYGNAPFFEYYAPFLAPLFKQKFDYLFDFNWAILEQLLAILQFPVEIELTPSFEKNPSSTIIDARSLIRPQGLVAPTTGVFQPVKYPQVFSEKTGFIANLSILDLIFCTGPQAILILEECFKPIQTN